MERPRGPAGAPLRGIEGLRAIAALMVLVFHCAQLTAPAQGLPAPLDRIVGNLHAGVPLFFSLSAFLLYRPFAAAIVDGRNGPALATYGGRRARRILPAYWAVLLYVSVGASVAELGAGSTGSLAPADLVRHLLLLQQYHPDTFMTGIPPAWSLTVEAAFYCVLPALAWIAARAATRATSPAGRLRAALLPAALMIGVGVAGKLLAVVARPDAAPAGVAHWGMVVERSLVGTADLFSFGLALAVLRVAWEIGVLRVTCAGRRWLSVVAGLGVAGVLAWRFEGWHAPLAEPLMALVATCVMALVVLPGPRASRVARLLDTRALVALGTISYSVYLWHFPLQVWLDQHGLTWDGPLALAGNAAVLTAATVVLSACTYRWIERPAMRRRPRRGRAPAEVLTARPATGG